ncbi:NADH dehydrogenase [Phlyctema vagabunda]|uniref:NADH dehydrogenase [ubiquinone] 1 beta subcomplex subunit 7 n=1 Tax=Phlyctema vagabunda TaxID=108571 RepID=A0ABR4PIL1_9HELO
MCLVRGQPHCDQSNPLAAIAACPASRITHQLPRMTVVDTVKSAVGLGDSAPAPATREAMRDASLPLAYRDSCANLLIPLNKCRVQEYYLPWKCENERHSYEKCQYEEFKKRVAKMDELRAAKDGARSN